MFVNLSNHPSAGWMASQREAALQLGAAPIVDIPFPEVAAELTGEAVVELARRVAGEVVALKSATAAMVQGEPVLAFAVVHLLRAAGIRCYAATTARLSTSAPLADGQGVRKTSEFRFVGFREYLLP